MGVKRFILKKVISGILFGGLGFAVIHAAVFWTAFFQCGGSGINLQRLTSLGSTWESVLKWTGFPLSCIDASGAAFVCVMIVNSLIWGAVVGFVLGLLFGRKS